MEHPEPIGLSRKRVEHLLDEARHCRSTGSRIEVLSRHLLGQSYKPNGLIGSADTPEVFTACLDGFDCVTYIETVLALACAPSVDDFTEWLRKIRYEQGSIEWKRRNHYMVLWLRNNAREGIVTPVSLPVSPIIRERVLNAVPGLVACRICVECIPKPAALRLAPYLKTGDLISFVSTRKNLDVFHAGIIVLDGKTILMRHASRSRGLVVEQELSEFLQANRMAGVIVVRPQGVTERICA